MKKIAAVLCLLFAFFLTSCAKEYGETLKLQLPETTTAAPVERGEAFVDTQKLANYAQLKALLETQEQKLILPSVSGDTYAFHTGDGNCVMHSGGKAVVPLDECIGFPFAELSAGMGVNPFQSFNALLDAQLVRRDTSEEKENGVEFDYRNLDAPMDMELNSLMFTPSRNAFAYSQEGAEAFLHSVIALAQSDMGTSGILYPGAFPAVGYSGEDDCYYSFVLLYDTSYAYITAVYLRSDDGARITDVTLQTMTVTFPTTDYAAGASIGMACRKAAARFEVVCLVTAIEQTLMGTCYFLEHTDLSGSHYGQVYTIPAAYQLGDYTAKLSRKEYLATGTNGDAFTMHIYSIRK